MKKLKLLFTQNKVLSISTLLNGYFTVGLVAKLFTSSATPLTAYAAFGMTAIFLLGVFSLLLAFAVIKEN